MKKKFLKAFGCALICLISIIFIGFQNTLDLIGIIIGFILALFVVTAFGTPSYLKLLEKLYGREYIISIVKPYLKYCRSDDPDPQSEESIEKALVQPSSNREEVQKEGGEKPEPLGAKDKRKYGQLLQQAKIWPLTFQAAAYAVYFCVKEAEKNGPRAMTKKKLENELLRVFKDLPETTRDSIRAGIAENDFAHELINLGGFPPTSKQQKPEGK